MAIEDHWNKAFRRDKKGSDATAERAKRTWIHLRKFCIKNKWDSDPKVITPKQVRLYLESRQGEGKGKISDRSIQNEAAHIRRALRGAERDVPDDKALRLDKENKWSSHRLSVPKACRIGGKAAADPAKWLEAKPKMPVDLLAVVNLIQELGFRKKEGIMSGPSLKEWIGELEKPESSKRGCELHVTRGTKGNRPRFQFVPAGRVEAVQKAVLDAFAEGAKRKGHVVDAVDLKKAMARYSNCMSRLGLKGDDSGHGLRRAYAQQQLAYYRDAGFSEKEALSKLSTDLGHGDKRGRWVWNNYIMGGQGDTA